MPVPRDKSYLVCDHCGEQSCWDGVLMCEEAFSAGACTRAQWEDRRLGRDRQQAQGGPQTQVPPEGGSQREGGEG